MNTEIQLRHKLTNWLQSLLLLAGMLLLLGMLGWFLGGIEFMLWTGVSGLILIMIGPKISPRLLL